MTLGLIACCLQDDVQCLRETIPYLCTYKCRDRRAQHFELEADVLPRSLKRVTNHGVTGLFGQPWRTILPMRDGAEKRTKTVVRETERERARRSEWPKWSMSGLILKAQNNLSQHDNSLHLSHLILIETGRQSTLTANKTLQKNYGHLKMNKDRRSSYKG